MTPPEVLLWQQLRGGALGRRFRRQHAVGPYILDFYCADGKLAIEVDGFAHDAAEQMRHDAVRTAWLNERGIRVLRVPAADVLHPERRVRVLEGDFGGA